MTVNLRSFERTLPVSPAQSTTQIRTMARQAQALAGAFLRASALDCVIIGVRQVWHVFPNLLVNWLCRKSLSDSDNYWDN